MPTSKLKATTIMTIALLGMLLLTQTSTGSISASQTIAFSGTIKHPLTDKQVTWADGSVETLTINNLGQIYLNGTETVAFGLNIVADMQAGSVISNQVLTTLQQSGVRFMALGASSYINNVSQLLEGISYWMPLLYNHKMWVALYIADDFANNLPPPAGTCTIMNVTAASQRVAGIVNGITNLSYANMIFAVGYNWELDNIGYSDAQVGTYLSNLYFLVRQTVDSSLIGSVPILGKNMGSASDDGTTAIVEYSDIPNYDLYLSTSGSWWQYMPSNSTWVTITGDWQANFHSLTTSYHNYTMPTAGKSGMNIWFAEAGDYVVNETNPPYSYQFTPAMFNYFYSDSGYNDTSALFLWVLQYSSPYTYSAFDSNGNPYPWFTSILNCYSTLK